MLFNSRPESIWNHAAADGNNTVVGHLIEFTNEPEIFKNKLEVTEDVDLWPQESISLAISLKYSHQFQSSTKDEQTFHSQCSNGGPTACCTLLNWWQWKQVVGLPFFFTAVYVEYKT